MHAVTIKNIETKIHPEIKRLFWFLFVGTRGGQRRIQIISKLRTEPSNKNKLSKELNLEYKGIVHHLKILERNNLVTKTENKYGAIYFVSPLFEEGEQIFNEIAHKVKEISLVQSCRY